MTDTSVELRKLKNGEFFTIGNHDNEVVDGDIVWIRKEYDHCSRKYLCVAFNNISRSRLFKATTRVFTGFIF